jgi:hypothetical protein
LQEIVRCSFKLKLDLDVIRLCQMKTF